MTHLTGSDFDAMRTGALKGDRLFAHLHHLEECRECAARAGREFPAEDAARSMRAAVSEAVDDLHPEAELPSYVGGTIGEGERAAIDEHLARCAACRAEVDDLHAWRRQLDAPPRAVGRWPAVAVLAAAAAVALIFYLRRDAGPAPVPAPSPAELPTATIATTSTVAPPPKPARKPEWEALVTVALQSGKLEIPADVIRFAAPDQYRGSANGETAGSEISPSATAIDEVRPTFTWPATKGARYEVIVESAGAEVARSEKLHVARWRPDAPLKRGATYRWQVIVNDAIVLPERPAPPAIFRVLTAGQHEEIEAARREHPNDHLLLGILYARAGEVRAAREHLRRAEAEELLRDLEAKVPSPRRAGRG